MTPRQPSRLLIVGLCVLALAAPGCRGCFDGQTAQQRAAQKQKEEEERKKKEEEEKKKAPWKVGQLHRLPSQPNESAILPFKPGHWCTVAQPLRRNYEDWVGTSTRRLTDRRSNPLPVDLTRFTIASQRPVALSKQQQKLIESTIYVPLEKRGGQVVSTLQGRDSVSSEVGDAVDMSILMQPHEYHIIVLATNPQSYAPLASLYSVDAPLPAAELEVRQDPGWDPPKRQYRVVAPELEDRVPLPDSLFCLTSTAYVLWDEVDPETFDPAQRSALVDWLHWGGQLIISGPDSLALLRDSFLAPYLPAEAGDAWQISGQDLSPMIQQYGVGNRGPAFRPATEWSGVRLKLTADESPRYESKDPTQAATRQLRSGDLFAERRVGRGRVLVSALQLNQRSLQNWDNGYECLVNALILRRPPRTFRENMGYTDDDFTSRRDQVSVLWKQTPGSRREPFAYDAGVNCQLRMLSRDTYDDYSKAWRFTTSTYTDPGTVGPGQGYTQLAPPEYPGGPGGWDDFNEVSTAARQALREAAGVEVPGAAFVIGCVSVYLMVLVPLNWMLFRAIGRVELAWLAAPLIAILGTVLVVKQAQLDIGFVRAQTEVALLETQPNYSRGCLTRYTGVYTSLSSAYDMTFDDPTAVAAPFADGKDFQLLRGQRLSEVTFSRQDKARLSGLGVVSNSTEMIHSEQVIDLGAAPRFGMSSSGVHQIENPTDYDLRHLAVVYRPADEENDKEATLRGCWIGELGRHESAALSFSPLFASEDSSPFADRRAEDASERGAESLNLEPLWQVALDPKQYEPGEFRAIARIDQSLPGMTITPQAAQQTGATLLVAHLQYDLPPPPEPDGNAPVDCITEN